MSEPGKKVKDENGVPVGVYDEFGNPDYGDAHERLEAFRERVNPQAGAENSANDSDDEDHATYTEVQAEEREARYHEDRIEDTDDYIAVEARENPDTDVDVPVDEENAN